MNQHEITPFAMGASNGKAILGYRKEKGQQRRPR